MSCYDDDVEDCVSEVGCLVESHDSAQISVSLGSIYKAIAGDVVRHLSCEIERTAQRLVEAAITAKIEEKVNAAVETALQKALEEGWQPTDHWGTPKGPKMTLADRIAKSISENQSYDKIEREINRFVTHAIEKVLGDRLKPEIACAVAKFKEVADSVVQAKLNETLKHALGLK